MDYQADIRAKLEPLIREARVKRVAKAAGVSHALLFGWFAGDTNLSPEALTAVAKALGYRVKIEITLEKGKP